MGRGRRRILTAIVVSAIVLAFVNDPLPYLATAVLMALAVWLFGKVLGSTAKWTLATVLSVSAFLPFALAAAVVVLKIRWYPEAAGGIAADTIGRVARYFAGALPYQLLEGIAGAMAGAIVKRR